MIFQRIKDILLGEISFRLFAYGFVILGVFLLASVGYDEYRGVTRAPSSRYTGYSHYSISKEAKPEEFHNAITVHLTRSFLMLFLGFVALMIDRGQEKVDPMAPDTDENIDEELRNDEQSQKPES